MKDNSTGKDKEFYELGKKMFDRLNPPGTPPFKPYVSKREWVGLTVEEVELYWDWEDFQSGAGRSTIFEMVRDIEAKLKEKNG